MNILKIRFVLSFLVLIITCASCKTKQGVTQDQQPITKPGIRKDDNYIGKPITLDKTDVRMTSQSYKKNTKLTSELVIKMCELTEEQIDPFMIVWDDAEAQMQETRRVFQSNKNMLRENIASIKANREIELRKIFTTEQMRRFKQMAKYRRPGRKN